MGLKKKKTNKELSEKWITNDGQEGKKIWR